MKTKLKSILVLGLLTFALSGYAENKVQSGNVDITQNYAINLVSKSNDVTDINVTLLFAGKNFNLNLYKPRILIEGQTANAESNALKIHLSVSYGEPILDKEGQTDYVLSTWNAFAILKFGKPITILKNADRSFQLTLTKLEDSKDGDEK